MASKVQIKRSSVPSKVPTTADLDLGELAINTYDGKVFLKKSVAGTESIVDVTSTGPTGQYIISSQQIFTANANQTTFSVNYTVGYVDVHLNGIKLVSGQDFTATNGSSVVLTTAATAGDIVDITAGNTFSAGASSANGIMPVELGGTASSTAAGARTNLGLGNVENKSSATIRSELTSTNVTTALGFTPYNSANPSGYISGNQTITFSGDATGSGTTSVALTLANSGVTAGTYGNANSIPQLTVDAKGRVTAVTNVGVNIPSGSLTFTGDVTGTGSTGSSTALTLANSGVTAGTYTKVTVDAKGRVTTGTTLSSADLPTYTGTITSSQVTTALGFTPYNSTNPSGYITSSALSSYLPLSGGTLTGVLTLGSNVVINFSGQSDSFGYNSVSGLGTYIKGTGSTYIYGGGSFYDGSAHRALLHAGNYTSYSPTLTGSGASGTWGINVTGNAATTSQRSFSGDITASGQGRFTGWYTGNAATGNAAEIGMSGGQGYIFVYNRDTSSYGTLNIASSGANMQFSGNTINVSGGSLQQGGSQVLHAGNYTSYSPTLTGNGASGTWGINVTGNAATVTTVTPSQLSPAVDYTTPTDASGYTWIRFTFAGGDTFNGGQQQIEFYVTRSINFNGNNPYGGCTAKFTAQAREWHGGQEMMLVQYGEHGSNSSAGAGFYISHARMADFAGGGYWVYLRVRSGITYRFREALHGGAGCDFSTLQGTTDPGSGQQIFAGLNLISTGGDVNFYDNGNPILHAGNYTGYSPSLTGSGASGTWGISITGNAANVTGTVAVANGGTGQTSLTANNIILGNGTSAVQFVAPGTSGNVLTSNGTTWVSSAISSGLPSQTGNSGKFLTTNGTTASWSDLPIPPPAPTNVTATASTSTAGRLDISWTASAAPLATSYNVYYSTASPVTTTNAIAVVTTTSTSAAITGLGFATYYIAVAGVNTAGIGGLSTQTSQVPNNAPTAPAITSASPATSSSLTVAWTAGGGNPSPTSHRLYYSTTSPVTTSSSFITATSSPTTLTGLSASTTYYVAIGAVNSYGTTLSSQSQVVTPPAGTTVYSAGQSLSISGNTSQTFMVASGVTRMRIRCVGGSGAGGGGWNAPGASGGSSGYADAEILISALTGSDASNKLFYAYSGGAGLNTRDNPPYNSSYQAGGQGGGASAIVGYSSGIVYVAGGGGGGGGSGWNGNAGNGGNGGQLTNATGYSNGQNGSTTQSSGGLGGSSSAGTNASNSLSNASGNSGGNGGDQGGNGGANNSAFGPGGTCSTAYYWGGGGGGGGFRAGAGGWGTSAGDGGGGGASYANPTFCTAYSMGGAPSISGGSGGGQGNGGNNPIGNGSAGYVNITFV